MVDQDKNTELGESLMSTLSTTSTELTVDTFQAFINELTKDTTSEIIGQIPMVKALVGLSKVGLAIRDYFFLKKYFCLLQDFKLLIMI